MTTGRRTKLNNSGFSLIELIVVILIMSVLTVGAAVGFSIVYNAKVDNAQKRLETMFQRAREEAMAHIDNDTWLKVYVSDEVIFAGVYMQEIGKPVQEVATERLGNTNISVTLTAYKDGKVTGSAGDSVSKIITDSTGVSIYYNPANGGLKAMTASFETPAVDTYYYLTDVTLTGSETLGIIIIPETGRVIVK